MDLDQYLEKMITNTIVIWIRNAYEMDPEWMYFDWIMIIDYLLVFNLS